MNPLIQLERATSVIFVAFGLACFGLLPAVLAVSPAPDGGYPGFTTAQGQNALNNLTTGQANTALGWFSLRSNTTGGFNTATGAAALSSNTIGNSNTANGTLALFSNTIGLSNTAIGFGALFNSSGSGNIALGFNAGTEVVKADNVICIGEMGVDVSNSCFIGQIFGQPIDPNSGTLVAVDTNGKLGTMLSARRFKRDIHPMDKTSEAILSLKPVTFHYKNDVKSTPCFGLVAEDVEKVNSNLVVRDNNGELLTVRYEAVNAMLLNEFLKEHKKVEEQNSKIQQQEATIAELKSSVAQQQKDFQAATAHQQKQIEAVTAGLQKVSAQLEASKPEPQVVENP